MIGAGLIGGSIARAAAASAGEAGHVAAWDRDAATREALAAAGFRVPAGVAELARTVDIAFVAVPPRVTVDAVMDLLEASPDVIVADAASVKGPVCDGVRVRAGAAERARFVPSHPLAGGAAHGWAGAGLHVLAGAVWAVCPEQGATDAGAAVRVIDAVTGRLSGRVLSADPGEHDRAVAHTSHMPHIAASALMDAVAADSPALRYRLSGGSLRDATRVAAADAALWEDILRHNREGLLEALDGFAERVARLRELVATDRWDEFRLRWDAAAGERRLLQRLRWEDDAAPVVRRVPARVDALLELGAHGDLIRSIAREGEDLVLEVEPA